MDFASEKDLKSLLDNKFNNKIYLNYKQVV